LKQSGRSLNKVAGVTGMYYLCIRIKKRLADAGNKNERLKPEFKTIGL